MCLLFSAIPDGQHSGPKFNGRLGLALHFDARLTVITADQFDFTFAFAPFISILYGFLQVLKVSHDFLIQHTIISFDRGITFIFKHILFLGDILGTLL